MALKLNVTTSTGVEAAEAYVKIKDLAGNKEFVQLNVAVYYSEEAYRSGKEYLYNITHFFKPSVEESSENFIRQGYEHLKTLNEYSQAIDC